MAYFRRSKSSPFAGEDAKIIDYKDVALLKGYISETGKIVPRRITGASTSDQRKISSEIKRARYIGLLPFCDSHK